MRGVGYVTLVSVRIRRAPSELAARGEIQIARRDARLGRPCVPSAPGVGAGGERNRFWLGQRALPFQVIRKERRLDLLAKISRSRRAKIDGAQLVPVGDIPPAMTPRTHDEKVERRAVVLLALLVDRDR